MERWGSEWQWVSTTMYRNRSWIDEVTYEKFYAKYGSQPQATVGEARKTYHAEFDIVTYVKPKVEATGQGEDSNPR